MPQIDVGLFEVSVDVKYPDLVVSAKVRLPGSIPRLGGTHDLGTAKVNLEHPSANLKLSEGINLGVLSGHVTVQLDIVADFDNTRIELTGGAQARVSGYEPKFKRKCLFGHCVKVPDGVKHVHKTLIDEHKTFDLSYGTPLRLAGLGEAKGHLDPTNWVEAINQGTHSSLPGGMKVTPNLDEEVQAMLTFVGGSHILHELKEILADGVQTVRTAIQNSEHGAALTAAAAEPGADQKWGLLLAYSLGAHIGGVIGAGGQGGFYIGVQRDSKSTHFEIGLFGTGFYDLGILLGGEVVETYSLYWTVNGVSALDNFKGAGTFIQAAAGIPIEPVSPQITIGLYWNGHTDGHFPPKGNSIPCGVGLGDLASVGLFPVSASIGQSQTLIFGTQT